MRPVRFCSYFIQIGIVFSGMDYIKVRIMIYSAAELDNRILLMYNLIAI